MLGNGLRRDYMGRYISQDWLKIKQLVAVLRLWFCGKNHFVALDLNYVFVQDHGLWLRKDTKYRFSVFLTVQTVLYICITKPEKGRQMSPNRKTLGIILVSVVWPGWSRDKRTNEESAAMLHIELFQNKKKEKHKVTHWWLCCSCNFPWDCNSLNDKKDGYNQISCSSHKNSC